ncbi:hypothetical protein Ae201684_009436 [Aphanomyces euteiches]|uniref:Uncharacterized protein n=1 Tax=Aphanomyces euteiches TaxID=100861 RepID=A0A6G0X1W4_9STRA|nr:hypothetical protein Ae201684_009436 [Aphanomyces euteiches]
MDAVPTKQVIQESFLGASTRRTYKTYQQQFLNYFQEANHEKDPQSATSNDCTDFLHHLYSLGQKARTIDCAKTAMVALFKEYRIDPNPAQALDTKQYVVGLQKYNRQHNLDDEKKAHPLSINELSILMNSFGDLHPFLGAMFRFLFSVSYLGCFRISEVLGLKWCDVSRAVSENGPYVSVRLRWHKKASVEKECQVYNLVDEISYPCLRVCGFHEEYVSSVTATITHVTDNAFVFPQVTNLHSSGIKVCWDKPMEQNYLRRQLNEIVVKSPGLSTNLSLHSTRRGGSFFRVFESRERRFNFRELMAWCRWGDPKTMCEYLVTKSLSDEIDPRNLLSRPKTTGFVLSAEKSCPVTAVAIADFVVKSLNEQDSIPRAKKPSCTKQTTLKSYVVPKTIPTARSAKEAWQQWFYADIQSGRPCALKDFTKAMIKIDRKKYSERQTLATAFSKFQSFELFVNAFAGHTETYTSLLKEVRKRKRECSQ